MAPNKKKAKPDTPTTKPQTSNKIATPDWPPFAPLIPTEHLSFHPTLPNQIVTIPNFFTAALCKTYVSFLSSLPLTTTPGKPKKGDAVRVNDRFQIDDPAFAERLWSGTALQRLVTGDHVEDGLGLDDAQRKELWGGDVVCLIHHNSLSCYQPWTIY